MNYKLIYLTLTLIIVGNQLLAQEFARGADVSWLPEMEQANKVFLNDAGVKQDVLQILQDHCINSIRLRVWVNPTKEWSSKKGVAAMALRASKRGMRIMIDFHYSDSWADPGQQTKPAQWTAYNTAQISQAVYDHTFSVLDTLRQLGITPEWCQIGNETNNGMLWDNGKASTNMASYAQFITSGNNAAHAVFPNIKTIVHLANGYDKTLYQWNIGGLISNGAKFDAIGMSLYPDSTNWQTTTTQCLDNMKNLVSLYGKPIVISEIGMAWNYSNVQAFVEDIQSKVQSLTNGAGLGIFWWEPECYDWQYYDKGAWNPKTFRPTKALDGFLNGCPGPKVKVTFIADFTGTTGNAFMTGTMTNPTGSWTIDPMQKISGTIYSKTYLLPTGSSGAFYLLQSNSWSDRETVPSTCASWYSTDRGYQIGSHDTTIYVTWNSCSTKIDCAGTINGSATIDACGICSGGTTGIQQCIKQTISLQKGWNIISTNVSPTDSNITTLFKGIDVQEIKDMNLFWRKGQPTALNSLKTISSGLGYLVLMNASGSLSVTGLPITTPTKSNSKFNIDLIGCPYQAATAFSKDYNTSNCSYIKDLNGVWFPGNTNSTLTNYEPGKGYFLKK